MAEHAPLTTGFVSGDPEPGWRNAGRNRWVRWLSRPSPAGPMYAGQVEARSRAGGWEWRHVPAGGHLPEAGDASPTPWVGCAPTGVQAMVDADHHARVCPL